MGLQIGGWQRLLRCASSAVHRGPWYTCAPGGSGCTLSSDSAGTSDLRLRLWFPPHLLISTHPRSCEPVGLPPVLQSLHPNPRRRKIQLGEIPAALEPVSGLTSSPLWWAEHSLVVSASPLNTILDQWTLTFFLSGSVSTFSPGVLHLLPFFTCIPFSPPFWRYFLKGKLMGIDA